MNEGVWTYIISADEEKIDIKNGSKVEATYTFSEFHKEYNSGEFADQLDYGVLGGAINRDLKKIETKNKLGKFKDFLDI